MTQLSGSAVTIPRANYQLSTSVTPFITPPVVSVVNRSIPLNIEEDWKWSPISKSVLASISEKMAYSEQKMYLATVTVDP